MSYIKAHNLKKVYGQGDASVSALREMSFQIHLGEFVGIMGESGAGKSTLLSILGAMNAPSSGTLMV
ncbi:MAG: ATP-binding cassette domain-containing protein, partial [bacterium]|nr:ATP-binding cassette domain-containing protein [bacterium]